VVYSHLGSSHQSTEDLAALRALPNLAILSPADEFEMAACMALALGAGRPVYLRMGKADLGPVHAAPPELAWGRLCPLRPGGGELAWVATGALARTALDAAEHWPGSAVWSAPCVKPLAENDVAALASRYR